MKILKPVLLIFFVLTIYIYVCNIAFLPDNIVIFQGQELNIKQFIGLKLNETKQTLSDVSENKKNNIEQTSFTLELFGTIPIKEIDVTKVPIKKVIPLGDVVGLKLYTDGVMVVGMSEIKGQDNIKHKPFENTGIIEGDRIIKINDNFVANTEELIKSINDSKGQSLEITCMRKDETITTNITPVKISDEEYKVGLWVRDAAAGVGTLTFYEPSSGEFAALGHAILDVDTSEIVDIANGELLKSNILAINKGQNGYTRRDKRHN